MATTVNNMLISDLFNCDHQVRILTEIGLTCQKCGLVLCEEKLFSQTTTIEKEPYIYGAYQTQWVKKDRIITHTKIVHCRPWQERKIYHLCRKVRLILGEMDHNNLYSQCKYVALKLVKLIPKFHKFMKFIPAIVFYVFKQNRIIFSMTEFCQYFDINRREFNRTVRDIIFYCGQYTITPQCEQYINSICAKIGFTSNIRQLAISIASKMHAKLIGKNPYCTAHALITIAYYQLLAWNEPYMRFEKFCRYIHMDANLCRLKIKQLFTNIGRVYQGAADLYSLRRKQLF